MRVQPVKRPAAKSINFAGSALDFVLRNPSVAGGATACAVAIGLISANALWYQSSVHPAPMFSTRDTMSTSSLSGATHKPAKSARSAKQLHDNELVGEIQSALANRGFYTSKVDGLFGSQTREAIEKFQKNTGIRVNGKPSVKLLTRILLSAEAMPATASIESIISNPANHKDEARPGGLIADIQAGLRNSGYQGVIVDGLMGSMTKRAIRRFQLDYGLEITGNPSPKVLKKLKEIGAVGRG